MNREQRREWADNFDRRVSGVEDKLTEMIYLLGFIARDTEEWERRQLRTALLREDQ